MAAPVWQANVDEYVWGNQESSLLVVTNVINNNEVKLLELIEYLGRHLLSTNHDIRARGTRFLSEILHNIPKDKLTTPEVGHLVSFYCDRLKDHHSVTPHALMGLLALSDCQNLAVGDAVLMVQAIIKEVHVQTLMQVDRRSVYNIVERFLDTRLTELQKLGNDFVYGYMQAMDGEKDPRNLIIVFRCIPIIIHNFPFERFSEELFEVTSCYFPIDFSPPSNDPYGVTTQDLVLGLRKCLSATSKFAEFCLPMLMEKVSSDIPGAKLDSFQTLTACAVSYDASSFSGYVEAIWSACRREVFQAVNKDVEAAALEALRHVIKKYSSAVCDQSSSRTLENSLDIILKECKQYIQEPGLRLMMPCCALLQAVASASDPACCKVLHSVIPQLLEQYQLNTQTTSRRKVLDAILSLLTVTKDMFSSADVSHPALSFKDDIVGILCSVLQDTSPELRQTGVRGFGVLVTLEALLVAQDLDLVGEHLVNGLFQDADPAVRVQCSYSLASMCSKHPDIVKTKLIPRLSTTLRTGAVPMETGDTASKDSVINMLATIATHSDVIQALVTQLLDYIFSISKDFSSEEIVGVSLQCVLDIVLKTSTRQNDVEFYVKSVLPQLVKMMVNSSLSVTGQTRELFTQENIIRKCASIIRNISQNLDVRLGEELSEGIIHGFLENDFTHFGFSTHEFKPFSVESPWQQTQLVVLLLATVCSVHQDVNLLNCPVLAERLFIVATQSDHGHTQTSAAQCLAGLINKWQSDEELLRLLENYKSRLEEIVNDSNQCTEDKKCAAMRTWNWITKALVLRGHTMASQFISTMISHLGRINLGQVAADGFKCVVTEVQEVMTLASHANIRIMYRQRFFLETISRISSGFQSTQKECTKFYLQAMSHLLRSVTKAVLLNELPPLMPMIVHSLLCEDLTLNLSTLEVLSTLIKDAPQIVSKDVDALLPQMMKLAGREQSMVARIAALKCLGDITTLPHHIVFPYKEKLIRFLGKRLDDKKRIVRKEVVKARNKWFLLGELKS
ncbi:MMS19 nucleotide excision repair protein homolog [Anneissia japonica]|uniref:MMS19 nucleotide excision repair protein homolog n=1 Tax=Anneissia japonica TaxID=1529436 RepID=UPI0014254C1F|nr:MMS19 nucleotide excision repair protein homolog [Anneissia japonica]